MRTPWGYEINSDIEPLLSADDFNEMTGGAYADNARVDVALSAASQAIRNYCGWHVCPAMSCTAYPAGGGKIARIPAAYVSEITAVKEFGDELTIGQYEWRRDGLLKRAQFRNWPREWDAITVDYVAGYDIEAVPDIAEAVRAITEGVLSVSAGVVSESADGVSISYSANAASVAAGLTSSQKDALAQYKVVSSHAA